MAVDIGAIIPSSRDALGAVSTRRRRLALLAVVETPADAKQVDNLGVTLLACDASGEAMRAIAAATKSVPVVCLAPVTSRDDVLAARFFGADAIAIEAANPAFRELAESAGTTHMQPFALVRSAGDLAAAVAAGARAVIVRAPSCGDVIAIAAAALRGLAVVAWPEQADLDAMRTLSGKVDAVIVAAALHELATFASFVNEVDP